MDMKKGKFAMSVLEIKDLHVEIEGKKILKGVNLTLKTGEVAAIMGPNGTGKSTLSAAIMGNPNYEVTKGEVLFDGQYFRIGCGRTSLHGAFSCYAVSK